MNSKVRDAQLMKVPYMLVVGDKEAAEGPRSRFVCAATRTGGRSPG